MEVSLIGWIVCFLISIFFILIYIFSVSVKIIIIGSTGKLGTKLLNYTSKNSIKIYGITCYTNNKKLNLKKKYTILTKSYVLSNIDDKKIF